MNEMDEFKQLHDKRLNLSNAIKENNAEGIKKLLENLYPDNAHFIYELLQNAEDAQATETAFILSSNDLVFIHNGKRKFSLYDIESITNIEASTKADDSTTIGKFGVGFKSVFTYTDSPEIKSGKWHFYIKDLFVPELTDKVIEKEFDREEYTFFRFPFNNPKKSPEKAFDEIKKGLKNLPLETLLFLNNIKQISWSDEIQNKLKRIERKQKDHTVELIDTENEDMACFLKFTAQKEIETEDSPKNISIGLAYRLTDNKIIPTDSRENVFIYFPAVKEDSHLRFLINAPFAAPNSRDSVLHNEENEKIIDCLVELQNESLSYIKQNGFLTVDFLNVLPNSSDNLDDFYKKFHTNLKHLFQTQDYTPTKSGEYRASEALYRSDRAEVCDVITDDDLSAITNLFTPLWCANVLKNTNADKLLNDLNINKWGTKELFEFLSNEDKINVCSEIFKEKEYKYLRLLYKTLNLDINDYLSCYNISDAPIFRTQNGLVCANDNVYFPEENKFGIPDNIDILNDDLFKGLPSEQKERLYAALKRIGVKEFDESERFQIFMKNFKKERKLDKTEIKNYLIELKMILKNKEQGLNCFRSYFILDGDNILRRPADMYIDTPYEKTNLEYLESISEKHPLSRILYKELSNSDRSLLIDLIKENGGFYELKIERQASTWGNPFREKMLHHVRVGETRERLDTKQEEDFDISYLDQIIEDEEVLKKTSHLIWDVLLNAKQNELNARYTANHKDSWHTASSSFICSLQNNAWILGKDGDLHKPQDITFDDLPENWDKPLSITEPLKAIHFGENRFLIGDDEAKKAGFESAQKMQKARQICDIFEKSGKSFDDFMIFCSQTEKELPESASRNPERRAGKVIEEYENSPEKTYLSVNRTVRVTADKSGSEAREFLSNEYINEDGEMFCQMCQKEMPFVKRDGAPYFEAIETFTELKKENKNQYIALCPNCAAEYDEWVRKNKADVSQMIKKAVLNTPYNGEKAVEIPFVIHGEQKMIRFTGTHFADLKTVLSQENSTDETEQSYDGDNEWGSTANLVLHIGDTVRHRKFGIGTVSGRKSNSIQIKFENVNDEKTFSCQCIEDYLEKKKD